MVAEAASPKIQRNCEIDFRRVRFSARGAFQISDFKQKQRRPGFNLPSLKSAG